MGQDRSVAPVDRCDTGIDIGHVRAQLAQLLTNQRPAVIGFDRDQLRLAFGEINHLERAGVLDQALDVIGDHLFRTDQHIDRNCVLVEQTRAGQVRRFTDTRDLGRRVKQRVGNLAGDHVGFIAAGHGDQHVGVVGTRLAQHRRIRAFALYGADVQAITQIAQPVAVGVDHGNVVGFARQMLGQCAAHLTGAQNDDFQLLTPAPPRS
ncbi:hypothetical protein ALP75_204168 [Pseudomonas syringae pv. actinidiae]|nr:hypothetical protein ALP75_204168 [Pseudomonas syringae pv. actinidiae]